MKRLPKPPTHVGTKKLRSHGNDYLEISRRAIVEPDIDYLRAIPALYC